MVLTSPHWFIWSEEEEVEEEEGVLLANPFKPMAMCLEESSFSKGKLIQNYFLLFNIYTSSLWKSQAAHKYIKKKTLRHPPQG